MTQYDDIIASEKEILLKMTKESEGWNLHTDHHDMKMYTKRIHKHIGVDCLKIVTTVEYPIEKLSKFLFYDVSKWTQESNAPTLKEKLNDDVLIMYFYTKIGWLISDRDFIVVSALEETHDHAIIVSKSIESTLYPELDSVVRGQVYHSGFVLHKIDDSSTKMHYFTLADPKGNIPSWVVNLSASQMLERAQTIKKSLK